METKTIPYHIIESNESKGTPTIVLDKKTGWVSKNLNLQSSNEGWGIFKCTHTGVWYYQCDLNDLLKQSQKRMDKLSEEQKERESAWLQMLQLSEEALIEDTCSREIRYIPITGVAISLIKEDPHTGIWKVGIGDGNQLVIASAEQKEICCHSKMVWWRYEIKLARKGNIREKFIWDVAKRYLKEELGIIPTNYLLTNTYYHEFAYRRPGGSSYELCYTLDVKDTEIWDNDLVEVRHYRFVTNEQAGSELSEFQKKYGSNRSAFTDNGACDIFYTAQEEYKRFIS